MTALPNHYAHLADLSGLVGRRLGSSDWVLIDQARIDQFAEATGDLQWIHCNELQASVGPYGGTIAHGFLTLSLMSSMFDSAFVVDDVTMGLNYGLNRVRFPAPVPVGSRVRGHFTLQAYEPLQGGAQLAVLVEMECEGQDKLVCVAETLGRRYTASDR
ncbi:MAG: MaoC family dehydratase [Ideonella sp.]|nr:MaoC family dehydratase [Ideonella sp.]